MRLYSVQAYYNLEGVLQLSVVSTACTVAATLSKLFGCKTEFDRWWHTWQMMALELGISTEKYCTLFVHVLSVITRWRSSLRHCATSRKVAGSIPDGVTGIFHWHNPSGRSLALGSTQPLTEMSTRNISWRPVRRADNLTTFMCRLSWNLGASTSWNPQGLSRPVMGLLYLFAICYLYLVHLYKQTSNFEIRVA